MRRVENSQLFIIGTGPMENSIKIFIEKNRLDNRVKMLGFRKGKDLENLIKNSMFGVVPSEWYENAPYSILEMMAYGKPVIGSNIGGISPVSFTILI